MESARYSVREVPNHSQTSTGELPSPDTSIPETAAADLDDNSDWDRDSVFSDASESGAMTPLTEYDSDAENAFTHGQPPVAPPQSFVERLRSLADAGLVGVTSRNEGPSLAPPRFLSLIHI